MPEPFGTVDGGVPFPPGFDTSQIVVTNKVAIAIQAREAMREHRKGKPVAFQHPRVPPDRKGSQ